MKQRDQVAMTPEEIATLLAESRKVHLATIGQGGMPHLVTMYYVMIDGQITFWTYRASQKAVNLAADPRISCLVESGEQYFDLRGIQVQGVARKIDDPAAVMQIGRLITAMLSGQDATELDEYVERAARKRVGYAVEPRRVISWDHSKLLPGG
ncbi:MAG TPA: pyridoxamine 5'-phosphate oxidase family protein [Streptosporangiaceae bacterium]|nr:pyridoxamine 5'-phosphate oxidase family protein [Streptosporangiaceae bacterium]